MVDVLRLIKNLKKGLDSDGTIGYHCFSEANSGKDLYSTSQRSALVTREIVAMLATSVINRGIVVICKRINPQNSVKNASHIPTM